MKNREKFREQILEWAVVPGRDICDFKRKVVLAHFGKEGCDGISCPWCAVMLGLWLDEEYIEPPKPEVDWDNVPVDTLVRVSDNESGKWTLRYFRSFGGTYSSYPPGYDYEVLELGATSVTAEGGTERWKYCELVEGEDGNSSI